MEQGNSISKKPEQFAAEMADAILTMYPIEEQNNIVNLVIQAMHEKRVQGMAAHESRIKAIAETMPFIKNAINKD